MKKILTTVALLAVVATPAFAATTHHVKKASDAYAMAPSAQDSNSPALTGGASEGYNQNEAEQVLTR